MRLLCYFATTLVSLLLASPAQGQDSALFVNGWEGCSTTNWTGGVIGTPIAGEPDDDIPVRRYQGRCALRATQAGNFVRDNSPVAEPKYRMRFYAYTGMSGAGEAVVFRATRASDSASMLRVSYDTQLNAFKIYVGTDAAADGTATGAADNRWYSVEIAFSNAAPAEVRYTIQGAGSTFPLPSANNVLATSAPTLADVVDTAEVGWVQSIGGPPTGEVVVDAFSSFREAPIGRLCRGDANGDGNRNSGDHTTNTSEILGGALATGQPDCTEDGVLDVRDRVCVAALFLSGQGNCL